MALEKTYAVRNLLDRQQARFVAVVQVGGVVSNLVGQVDELRLQRRPLVEQILGQFGMLLAARNRASA